MCLFTKHFTRAIASELSAAGLDPLSLMDEPAAFASDVDPLAVGMTPFRIELMARRMLARSGNPALGLALGRQARENMLPIVGHLLQTCQTLEDKFNVLVRYGCLLAPGLAWHYERTPEHATFGFSRPALAQPAAGFVADWMLAFLLSMNARHCGRQPTKPLRLLIAGAPPSYGGRYQELAGCPVQFGQPFYGIVFAADDVDRRQPHPNHLAGECLRALAESLKMLTPGSGTLADRVRYELVSQTSLANIDFSRLANSMGLGARALRRRLRSEGLLFSTLLDEARRQRAEQELAVFDTSIKEIASRLGYADVTSFHRAFKRATGETPGDYRRRRRSNRPYALEQSPA